MGSRDSIAGGIQEFLDGGFKQNLYDITINLNNASDLKSKLRKYLIEGYSNNDKENVYDSSDTLSWSGICTEIRVPGNDINDVNTWGNYRIGVTKSKEYLTLTFIEDQWQVNSNFWRFLNLYAIDENTGIMHYRDDYQIDSIEIVLYTPSLNQMYKYTFKSCFAKTTPEINLNAASTGMVTFPITVSFENYTVEKMDGADKYSERKNHPITGNKEGFISGPQSSNSFLGNQLKKIGGDLVSRVAPGIGTLLGNTKELGAVAGIVAENVAKNLGALGGNALSKLVTGVNISELTNPSALAQRGLNALFGVVSEQPKEIMSDLAIESAKGPQRQITANKYTNKDVFNYDGSSVVKGEPARELAAIKDTTSYSTSDLQIVANASVPTIPTTKPYDEKKKTTRELASIATVTSYDTSARQKANEIPDDKSPTIRIGRIFIKKPA